MSALQVPAFLTGVRDVVAAIAPNAACGVRPGGNGAPLAAYKGGEWYYGVFWQGMQSTGMGSREEYGATMAVGIDITRVLAKVPTAKAGDWFLQPGEMHTQIGRVTELLMRGGSAVAAACNAAYARMAGAGGVDGVFRECFDAFRASPVRTESGEWIASVADAAPTVYACTIAFSGLKFHKLLSELP